MNAIIALCHFCEVHGPSVVLCTQPFHAKVAKDKVQHHCGGDDGTENLSGDWFFNKDRRPKSSLSSTSAERPPTPTSKTSDSCEACRSFVPGQSNFISKDTDAAINYMSSQYPEHSRLYSIVRQACLRSLSCEVCPGREGPIYFGDERMNVLSHTFFMKDSQARGLQRWYSVIVVMMDRIYLLNSWPFLVQNIRQLLDELQSKAEKVYKAEQAEVPQRAKRINSEFMTPGNFRRQRSSGGKPARSLVDLTNDRNIFKYLHMSFAWILKACGNRLTEKVLEGSPTEDALIHLEKQEGEKIFRKSINFYLYVIVLITRSYSPILKFLNFY
ncbi:folliculin-like protein [Saccoglossus kowalevskii]|uniref:Folliculin-like protein n=1 Tax=Saccoglossus kowalevskii TaxID=10224 RepID=D1LX15_SACKO|nr:folliculin-like protein [Saccoglossus kowalevskii]ACY92521.1 folliculin-like protein [Saccoglossus kowalevskii]